MEVKLQPVGLEHAAAMTSWLADPDLKAGLGVRREITLDSTRNWIEAAQRDPAIACFAISADGTHVGNVTIDQIDPGNGLGRFSIYLGDRGARGKGVATQATRRLADLAFTQMGLRKLWLIVHVRNLPAIFTYLKAGFIVEGCLRQAFRLGSESTDAYQMGLLSTEYRAG